MRTLAIEIFYKWLQPWKEWNQGTSHSCQRACPTDKWWYCCFVTEIQLTKLSIVWLIGLLKMEFAYIITGWQEWETLQILFINIDIERRFTCFFCPSQFPITILQWFISRGHLKEKTQDGNNPNGKHLQLHKLKIQSQKSNKFTEPSLKWTRSLNHTK